MTYRKIWYLVLSAFALVAFSIPDQQDTDGWIPVSTGIEYKMFTLPDPNNVFVARMERSNPEVTLESSMGQGKLVGGIETVRNMYLRYDQAINYWGSANAPQSWGARNHVVVAINGSFYNATGVPESGQIHSGWYGKRYDDLGGSSGFVWNFNREAFIGGCVNHDPAKQIVHDPSYPSDPDAKQIIDGVNVSRGADELILYTPQYDASTGTGDSGIEILVEMERPTMMLPPPNRFAVGFIQDIRDGQGSTLIPFDHIVLSAHGDARDALMAMGFQEGDEIRVSQQLTHYETDCDTQVSSEQWTKSYAGISGSFHFLKGGEIQSFNDNSGATSRHPRTAIAYNDAYIYFIVVDGRNPGVSIGMTIQELALFARDTLGATDGIAQDGGGSSTMVVNGRVVNNTHCNHVDCSKDPPESQGTTQTELVPTPTTLPGTSFQYLLYLPVTPHSAGLQRLVANGMMMVVVEPMAKSTTFGVGTTVSAITDVNVRLGPGTNYAVITAVPQGTEGVVIDHFNDLEGVYAKGLYWWKVDFGGTVGWVAEDFLIAPNPLLEILERILERLEF